MRRPMYRTLAPVALVAALALSACSTGDPAGFDEGADQDAEQTAGTGDDAEDAADEPTGSASDAPDTASAAGSPSTIDPSDVVASHTYEFPGDTEGTVTVGVHSLRVDGDAMLLELYFTPEVPNGDDESYSVYDMSGGGAMSPQLHDRENLKTYSVVRADSQSVTADLVHTQADNGQTVVWWAYYAAPQDDIDSIAVATVPGVPEFPDVPIER